MVISIDEIKKLREEYKTNPFGNREENEISGMTEYIDSEIVRQAVESVFLKVKIPNCYCRFKYSPITKQMSDFTEVKSTLMSQELSRRYEDKGWCIQKDMPGDTIFDDDYWYFTEKRDNEL